MEFSVKSRVRRSAVILGAVVAVLAALVSVPSPAAAADVITFRAATQASWNQATARVTIPATVRETDGMLLFVTANKDVNITTPPAGWTLEGTRLSNIDTETRLYSKVAAANDAGTNAAVTFSETAKSTLTFLAYDGTAADPIAVVASAAEVSPAKTHAHHARRQRRDRRLLRRLLLGRQVRPGDQRLDPPAGQTQRSIGRHRRRPHLGRRLRHQRARAASARARAAPRPAPSRAPRRPCGPSCSRPTRPSTRTSRRWRRSR